MAEGHEIGNHTYYHPNLAICWPEHIRLELNATQLLLETITGRSTTLFRPPYAADTSPSSLADLAPLRIADEMNYLVVLENIDPQDWARPGADVDSPAHQSSNGATAASSFCTTPAATVPRRSPRCRASSIGCRRAAITIVPLSDAPGQLARRGHAAGRERHSASPFR